MGVAEVSSQPVASTGIINSAAYSNGVRVADVPIDQASEVLRHRDRFVWIGLFEPSEELLERVQKQFGLHDLAIEDAHSAHQRPKLERYEDSLFVVLRTAHLAGTPHKLEFGETHIFVGRNYIVSVRHGSLRSHVGVRAKCESLPELLKQGPTFVLYALMDFVVDQYFPIVEGLEDDFEALEDQIFGEACSSKTTRNIYKLRRDLIALKRAISPLIEVCNRLTKFDIDLIPAESRPYFRDVYDHVMRINEMIDSLRELLATALESNLALISEQHTVQTKRLAAWAAIIAVPTMIAGIYGMNFTDMPELSWHWGYPTTIGLMAIFCGGLFIGFRRSGWL
ncbi:MAG TPA: magnesium/cobalt transporter CorA [Thermoanaerobaculia bacterium]|jgi:magnesium transporter|nr:magnesium/cobalt transporter CorA [Thermoanaerobaculia bacterium]